MFEFAVLHEITCPWQYVWIQILQKEFLFYLPCLLLIGTVLQPKLKKKKSVSKLEVKDTKEANKYMLTHQDVDSAGELETQLIKVRGRCGRSWIYN
jgi:hypothetical protein